MAKFATISNQTPVSFNFWSINCINLYKRYTWQYIDQNPGWIMQNKFAWEIVGIDHFAPVVLTVLSLS